MAIKSRGLGRGLNALFGDEEPDDALVQAVTGKDAPSGEASAAADPSRRVVSISQLDPNPDQPRTHFDEDAIKALAASIKQHGLLQPILVREKRMEPGRYEIIAGERRWRASQRAQLHEVPIIIRDLDDSTTFQIALIENLQREDLNAMEEAKGYHRLGEEFGLNHEQIGEAIGKSRSHVANMIRLLQLPNSVQSMVTSGQLSAGHARALLNSENPALLAQEIAAKGLSVRQAEQLAKANAGANFKAKKSAPEKDADLLALEKDLTDKLGMTTSIAMKGEKKGVLSIDFSNLDQLDDIIRRLAGR